MARRSEYIVTNSLEAQQSGAVKEKETSVFADEISLTQTGDLVFSQVRDIPLMSPEGQMKVVKDMVMVLVIPRGQFAGVRAVAKGGSPLYQESGEIELAH